MVNRHSGKVHGDHGKAENPRVFEETVSLEPQLEGEAPLGTSGRCLGRHPCRRGGKAQGAAVLSRVGRGDPSSHPVLSRHPARLLCRTVGSLSCHLSPLPGFLLAPKPPRGHLGRGYNSTLAQVTCLIGPPHVQAESTSCPCPFHEDVTVNQVNGTHREREVRHKGRSLCKWCRVAGRRSN